MNGYQHLGVYPLFTPSRRIICLDYNESSMSNADGRVIFILSINQTLLGHRSPSTERKRALIHHADQVRVCRCQMYSRFLVLRRGFLGDFRCDMSVSTRCVFYQHFESTGNRF